MLKLGHCHKPLKHKRIGLPAWGNSIITVSTVSWPSAASRDCRVCGATLRVLSLVHVVIYSERTRLCLWKADRRLSYLWTYRTFRVSFRKHTAFKHNTAHEGTDSNVTAICRLMIHRWQVDRKSTPHSYTGENFCLSWGVVVKLCNMCI
jgi:hypothetical protein